MFNNQSSKTAQSIAQSIGNRTKIEIDKIDKQNQ